KPYSCTAIRNGSYSFSICFCHCNIIFFSCSLVGTVLIVSFLLISKATGNSLFPVGVRKVLSLFVFSFGITVPTWKLSQFRQLRCLLNCPECLSAGRPATVARRSPSGVSSI